MGQGDPADAAGVRGLRDLRGASGLTLYLYYVGGHERGVGLAKASKGT